MRRFFIAFLLLNIHFAPALHAQDAGNLLRNARFQDDWLTAWPELKNHNWNYSMESYNRRDYVPDAWNLRGSWEWLDVDAPWGQRRLVLRGPGASMSQNVNWCGIHDQRPPYEGFPDAGGFPRFVTPTSRKPERLVRDLRLSVKLKGKDVPANAGTFSVAWGDPVRRAGGVNPPMVEATWPAGTYADKTVEISLPAAKWLDSIKGKADAPLPDIVQVAMNYKGLTGEVELLEAHLISATAASPNLLSNGWFEEVEKDYPKDWSRPAKYRYFPPGYYYIFNTWHNASFDNRGVVRADSTATAGGKHSLQMTVPPGDELAVTSAPVILNQKEPRLLELTAWVKTDSMCMLQVDAVDEKGERLDCFNFIHKLPQSIGTDRWRLIRQIFRPRQPLKSIRVQLCARGVNGYTLGGVAPQPQANVIGSIRWDNVTLREPESEASELTGRGIKSAVEPQAKPIEPERVDDGLWPGNRKDSVVVAIGSAYLRPEQKQFVRLNLLLTSNSMATVKSVRLDVLRRSTGAVLITRTAPASPADLRTQRAKIPVELRDDFRGLLLADLDVAALPLQPFNDPQRNWFVRATVLDNAGKPLAASDSISFCRLAHEAKQPPVQTVRIDNDNLLYVNNQPWMPWGVCYGHNPVYDGPADPGPGKYLDLRNPPAWNLYDRHGGVLTRAMRDFNCKRYLPGNQDLKQLQDVWDKDNTYASSAFYSGGFSLADYFKTGGGQAKTDAWLAAARTAPSIVSIAPGIEEAFGYFVPATSAQIAGLKEITDHIRKVAGKPVMVGHGGYWNRFEFERVPFFDIYDPETEPLYPAPVHVELMPLLKGKPKVAWLRPQMYEPVPYERWRYHVWVELMRGVRGWQMAHGPADPSLFRGLHGEMELIKPAVYSKDKGPAVTIEPWIEHWSRRHNGKTYLAAATTHGLTLGNWRWISEPGASTPGVAVSAPGGRARVTGKPHDWRQEDNGYAMDKQPYQGPSVHSIQWLPDAKSWPAGTKLVQWVRLDPMSPPQNLVLLARGDCRWTHAVSWGAFDASSLHKDLTKAHWFLRAMYRHASGFIGWDDSQTGKMLQFIPGVAFNSGPLPKLGEWVRLEVPLEKLGAADKLLDGVGFLHEVGRVEWGRTSLMNGETERIVWGDNIGPPPEQLAKVKMTVAGLKKGTKIRVLFEDRELVAEEGYFTDDYRGQDLYQRHGGGPYTGYGDTPVALHVYEIPGG